MHKGENSHDIPTKDIISKKEISQIQKKLEQNQAHSVDKNLEEPWIYYAGQGSSELFYGYIKRMIDIIVAGIGIIVTLPLMMLIACFIKLDSPGPFIFRQKRIGQNRRYTRNGNGHLLDRRNGDLKGKPFYIYKFRTMKQNVDHNATSPSDNFDPRLTRIGRIIRPLCLDELLQLINVLTGDMSLVGPRPEMYFVVQNYGNLESLRLAVKPGVTGLWQLYGSRKKHIHENLQYDLDYIKNRSVILDIKIMLKTIDFMFHSKNV